MDAWMDGYTQLTFLLHFRRQISQTPNAFFDLFETKTMASYSEMLIV